MSALPNIQRRNQRRRESVKEDDVIIGSDIVDNSLDFNKSKLLLKKVDEVYSMSTTSNTLAVKVITSLEPGTTVAGVKLKTSQQIVELVSTYLRLVGLGRLQQSSGFEVGSLK